MKEEFIFMTKDHPDYRIDLHEVELTYEEADALLPFLYDNLRQNDKISPEARAKEKVFQVLSKILGKNGLRQMK